MRERQLTVFYGVYQLCLCVLTLILAPFLLSYLYFFKKKERKIFERLSFRLKFLAKQFDGRERFWIHCVSVGELLAAGPVIEQFLDTTVSVSSFQLVLTTTTVTAQNLAKKLYGGRVALFYAPLDYFFSLNPFFRCVQPKKVAIMETEIWPGLFSKVQGELMILNGRVSDRSFWKYRLLKPFLKPVLRRLDRVVVQSSEYKRRFVALGCRADRVVVADNLKYIAALHSKRDLEADPVFSKWLLSKKEELFVIVCASTHRGEDNFLIDWYSEVLPEKRSKMVLVIVPRQIHRCGEIHSMVSKKNISCTFYDNDKTKGVSLQADSVCVVHTIGDLFALYALADLVIMGGTFLSHGGHNPIEPAVWGKPIITGADMSNFVDIEKHFLKNSAMVKATGKSDCFVLLKTLINDPSLRKQLGHRAQNCVETKGTALEVFLKTLLTEKNGVA